MRRGETHVYMPEGEVRVAYPTRRSTDPRPKITEKLLKIGLVPDKKAPTAYGVYGDPGR